MLFVNWEGFEDCLVEISLLQVSGRAEASALKALETEAVESNTLRPPGPTIPHDDDCSQL